MQQLLGIFMQRMEYIILETKFFIWLQECQVLERGHRFTGCEWREVLEWC